MNSIAGNTSTLKRINAALIRDVLRGKGTATRGELAEITRLSQPTVNAIVQMLVDDNEVICQDYTASNGGRRAQLYALNPRYRMVAAVFAMADRLDFAATDAFGTVLTRGSVPVSDPADCPAQIVHLIQQLQAEYPAIRVAGVTFPGAVTPPGELFAAPQLPQLEWVNLRSRLQAALSIPVIVENDVKLRALGYYGRELAGKSDSMVYLHLSTRLSSAIILQGRCHCGYSNFSGEVGYLAMNGTDGAPLESVLAVVTEEASLIELLSRLALGLICVVDPPFFVMGGPRITSPIMEQVRNRCVRLLPKGVLPHFLYAADEPGYLYAGIAQFAQEQTDPALRIVSSCRLP